MKIFLVALNQASMLDDSLKALMSTTLEEESNSKRRLWTYCSAWKISSCLLAPYKERFIQQEHPAGKQIKRENQQVR